MDDALFQRMKDHITKNEGYEDKPYKENKGNITVGTGFKIETAEEFAALPFKKYDPETGQWRDTSKEEKLDEFKRIQNLPREQFNNDASRFKLEEAGIGDKLESEIESHADKVKKAIGENEWNTLTDDQKIAFVDIHFANGSIAKFPELIKSAKTGNAETMANETFFNSGKIPGTNHSYVNFDRSRRNYALMKGIDPESEAAFQKVANKYPDHPKLPDNYKKYITPPSEKASPTPASKPAEDKSSDASDVMGDVVGQSEQAPRPQESETASNDKNGATEDSQHDKSAPPQDDAAPQTAQDDHRIRAMQEMAARPIENPAQSILLKPAEKWTKEEMQTVLASAQRDFPGWRANDPLKAHMYERTQDWHSAIYGDAPTHLGDGQPVRPIPINPSAHATPQGEDLWAAAARMGDKLEQAAKVDGYAPSVKALQRGLNMLNDSLGMPQRSDAWGPSTQQAALKVDGAYGPKTDFALKTTLARHGTAKADDALALGRFGNFADQVRQSGKADRLDKIAQNIFAPLHGGSDAPKGALQETLNTAGRANIADWRALKVDDWIGPKTTDAFAAVMQSVDPEDFTRAFGKGLGML